MSWNCRSAPSVTRSRGAPDAAYFISSRSRFVRSSTANCWNVMAVIGLGRFSASFWNVLYASTVYWKRRPSWVSSSWVVVVSTAVIASSFDLRHLHDHVANQLRLAREAIRRLELFVRLIGRRRREVVPPVDHFHSAGPARAVTAANVSDGDAHFQGGGEQRLCRGKLRRFALVDED